MTSNTMKIISTATLALMLSAGVAAAQTTYPTTNTGTDQTGTMMGTTTGTNINGTTGGSSGTGTTGSGSGTTTGTKTPGTPNTGAGGDSGSTLLTLIASAFAALVGATYLVTRKSLVR
jgi:hypothetical protein